MNCNHAINMDMAAALGTICLAQAALDDFQQTVISRTVFWPPTTGNAINVDAATSAGRGRSEMDPSITFSDDVCSAPQLFTYSDESSNKKDVRDWNATKWHQNKHSLLTALVSLCVLVSNCLGLPQGGINYPGFFKGLLWSVQKSTKWKCSRGI